MAIRPYSAGWAEVADVMVRPVVCGLASFGTAWYLATRMAEAGYGNFAQLVATVVIAVGLNAVLAWFAMRPVCDDLWVRVWWLVPARRS